LVALLVLLFVLAPLVTTLAWLDATRWHLVLVPLQLGPGQEVQIPEENLQRLKQSILHVRVHSCSEDTWATGTGFVISPGYVATAAHVVKENQACGNEVEVVDYRGLTHPAELSGYSAETQLDLAILTFRELELPALPLADSDRFESADTKVDVITIGYPPAASTQDQAAISAPGVISSARDGRIFTSGMGLNPGNSGGPVFVMTDWSVLGVAVQKGDATKGAEGLGVVVPSNSLAQFFQDRTGKIAQRASSQP
jgi:S1-C subfamily serine protease